MLVALGVRWERLLGAVADALAVSPRDMDLVRLVGTPKDVLELLREPPPSDRPRAFG